MQQKHLSTYSHSYNYIHPSILMRIDKWKVIWYHIYLLFLIWFVVESKEFACKWLCLELPVFTLFNTIWLLLIQILIPLLIENLQQMDLLCSWENQENGNALSETNLLRKSSQMFLNEGETQNERVQRSVISCERRSVFCLKENWVWISAALYRIRGIRRT